MPSINLIHIPPLLLSYTPILCILHTHTHIYRTYSVLGLADLSYYQLFVAFASGRNTIQTFASENNYRTTEQ